MLSPWSQETLVRESPHPANSISKFDTVGVSINDLFSSLSLRDLNSFRISMGFRNYFREASYYENFQNSIL